MYICFNDAFYKIEGIQIDTDDKGQPVDLCIKVKAGDYETLDTIAGKYAEIGYNRIPTNDEDDYAFALYGRLKPFHIEWDKPEMFETVDW